MHSEYNRTKFPIFICNHGNWDIYANARGHCAAIPTDAASRIGCNASHFGDAAYTRATLGIDVAATLARLGAIPATLAQRATL